jgi:peptidyl-prolyl cis-trans isomerase B (cyclophilin B)
MPRQRKQHLNQRTSRRKNYQAGGATGEKYKPGFPMNLFQRSGVFWGIALVAMVGGLIAAAFIGLATSNQDPSIDTPQPTSTIAATTTAEGTPGATATVRAQYPAAGPVLVATSSYTATISTAKGEIELELFAQIAPNTVNSFVFLAQEGFFDGQVFHRVIDDFVVQAGDPDGINGNGLDGPGYQTADEPNEIRNTPGTMAMAKTGGATSFGSQFFISMGDNAHLDYDNGASDSFYPFGQVTSGMDVVESLEMGDLIESITIVETPDPNAPTATPTATVDSAATTEETAEATATTAN